MSAFICYQCSYRIACEATYPYQCPICGGILVASYEDDDYANLCQTAISRLFTNGIDSIGALLPLQGPFPWRSLGEGGTPLIACDRLASNYGVGRLWAKNEGTNPTGSFKDRPLAVAAAKVKECGVSTLITSSSGNAGAAMAAYAARAGLRAIVVAPSGTPTTKLAQAADYGAHVVTVDADVSGAWRFAQDIAHAYGWINVATTFLSPVPIEGNKSVAYELAHQLNWRVPDYILVPVGAGPLLAGLYLGYRELNRKGIVAGMPRLVAVQARGCAPIAQAFEAGESSVVAWDRPATIAKAIGDPLTGYEQDGTLTLALCRNSGGAAVAVNDEEILTARRKLSMQEGLSVEPTAAASVAGLRRLAERRLLDPGTTVVSLLTGHGLKGGANASGDSRGFPEIAPRIDNFRHFYARQTGPA